MNRGEAFGTARPRPMKLALCAFSALILFMCLAATGASAAPLGALTAGNCFSNDGDACQTVGYDQSTNSLFGYSGNQVVVSPDGRFVYEDTDDGILEFARNRADGNLTQIGCVSADPDTGCTQIVGLDDEEALFDGLVISPDGTSLYASYIAGDEEGPAGGVAGFSRDPTTGLLSYNPDNLISGSGSPLALAISPNGNNVYVTDADSNLVQDYAASDGGVLSNEETDASAPTTSYPTSVVVSPDGTSVYVVDTGSSDDYESQIDEYQRADDGSLTPAGCISASGCATTDSDLSEVSELAVSPNGRFVYAADSVNGVLELSRSSTGSLTPLGCVGPGPQPEARPHEGDYSCPQTSVPFVEPNGIAVSPDGANVYVASAQGLLASFSVNSTTGALTPLPAQFACQGGYGDECAQQDYGLISGVPGPMAFSPDGTSVYDAVQDFQGQDGGIAELSRSVAGENSRSGATWGSTAPDSGAAKLAATLTVPTISCTKVPASTVRSQLYGGQLSGFIPAGSALTPTQDFAGVLAKCSGDHASYTAEFIAYNPSEDSPVYTVTTAPRTLRVSPGDLIRLNVSQTEGTRLTLTDLSQPHLPQASESVPQILNESGWQVGVMPAQGAPVPSTPALFSDVSYNGTGLAHAKGVSAVSWSQAGSTVAIVSGRSAKGNQFTAFTSGVPVPRLHRTTIGAPASGTIRYHPSGSNKWIYLKSTSSIPNGAVIDATHGKVELSFSLPDGRTQTALVWAGVFVVHQHANGSVVFTLQDEGALENCPAYDSSASRTRSSRALARVEPEHRRHRKKHKKANIWASAHGSFSTSGSNGSASVLGTKWLTRDQCDGTYFQVAANDRDKVDAILVTVFYPHHHTVRLHQGQDILAPAPGY